MIERGGKFAWVGNVHKNDLNNIFRISRFGDSNEISFHLELIVGRRTDAGWFS